MKNNLVGRPGQFSSSTLLFDSLYSILAFGKFSRFVLTLSARFGFGEGGRQTGSGSCVRDLVRCMNCRKIEATFASLQHSYNFRLIRYLQQQLDTWPKRWLKLNLILRSAEKTMHICLQKGGGRVSGQLDSQTKRLATSLCNKQLHLAWPRVVLVLVVIVVCPGMPGCIIIFCHHYILVDCNRDGVG